jgi:metal-responsive CopG/Arc/MetJ family transcriptional regulator
VYSLKQLEKQQVGLRLPAYLVEEMDEFTKQFALNRTDIITEAIKSYLVAQKEKMFYEGFDSACKEVVRMQKGELKEGTLSELIDELNHNPNA